MRSIQATAIILWVIIFIVLSFALGQFLASKNIFDITKIIINTENKDNNNENDSTDEVQDEIQNDVVINKIGQETLRIGQNVAKEYFLNYYKEYINYVMQNKEIYDLNKKVTMTSDVASDYVFYALANNLDESKYIANVGDKKVDVSEANVNSFVDNMFNNNISDKYKTEYDNGYNKKEKTYSITRRSTRVEFAQEIVSAENITSNQMILKYSCKKIEKKNDKSEVTEQNQVNLTVVYRGGRYIVTEVQKLEIEK